MTESLFIACMAIVICIAVLLIIWLVVSALRKGKSVKGKVVSINDTDYVLVPVGESADRYVARAARPKAQEEHVSQITESQVFPAHAQEEAVEEAAATEAPATEAPATEAPAQEQEGGAVVLHRNTAMPYPEAYAALSPAEKRYVDDILAYAESKEGAKLVTNDNAACVYFGKKQLVRIILRRGKITARMQVQNNALASYADDNNFNLREKPVDVRVESAATVGYIKGIIDINYATFKEEREMKEAKKKEERRLKRQQKRQAASEN